MKKLINIRGAVATGKTTAVRQFCERRGFHVETIETPDAFVPVSVINGGRIVVLGDYSKKINCTGVDSFRRKDGSACKNETIWNSIIGVERKYDPEIIIYEHMLTSNTFKGTKNIADVGRMLGYEYFGVQLFRSEESRLSLLKGRSGASAGTKSFSTNGKRTNRATVMLNEGGYRVKTVNVEKIAKNDMWRVIENAIEEAV